MSGVVSRESFFSYLGELTRCSMRSVAVLGGWLVSQLSYAAGAGMPWEDPLLNIADSITGPVAQVGGVVAIFAAGVAVAFSQGGGALRQILWAVLGLSVAFAAATFFLPFLGFGGGVSI